MTAKDEGGMSTPDQTEAGEMILGDLAERAILNPKADVHGLILGVLLQHVVDIERRLEALETWKYNQEEAHERNR